MSKQDILDNHYGLYIGGEWTDGSEGEQITTINPSTGEKLATFINGTEEDIDSAVKAAEKAFETWGKTSRKERAELLLQIADKIDENKEFLATIDTLDKGKPYQQAMDDVNLSVDQYRYFASAITVQEDGVKEYGSGSMTLILKEPKGVVGQIIPWNFPFMMSSWKLAPALAAGNTVVIKPAEQTPLSLLEFVKIVKDILPKGVLNIVTGYGEQTGEAMQNHEGIKKLAFTGSTPVGRQIGISAAKRLIPSTLELGGKSANIIFNDADFDEALQGATDGILMNQGESCDAGSRILVQDDIYDEFVPKLIERFENIKVGDPFDEDTEIGAQVSEEQMNKILDYFDTAQKENTKILTGGERITEGNMANGYFLKPTLIESDNQATTAREEIFGPVANIIRFKDAKEAIEIANDTEFGLAGGVFTKDIDKGIQVSKNIETGMIWVNTYHQILPGSPFGGYKNSGLGRELHTMTLDEYTETKSIVIKMNDNIDEL